LLRGDLQSPPTIQGNHPPPSRSTLWANSRNWLESTVHRAFGDRAASRSEAEGGRGVGSYSCKIRGRSLDKLEHLYYHHLVPTCQPWPVGILFSIESLPCNYPTTKLLNYPTMRLSTGIIRLEYF
jgi:hypothetical protein